MPNEQTVAGDPLPPNSATIEVRVRELSQLFNSMDPSPFREKDLDRDAEQFIVSWAKELPADAPLALLVHLDRPAVAPNEVRYLRDAVDVFFAHRADLLRNQLRQLLRQGRISLIIALLFLAACLLLGNWIARFSPHTSVTEILKEGLLIGGWVAMWRPLEIFLYDWWPILSERRIYDRLGKMSVRVVCTGANYASPPPDM